MRAEGILINPNLFSNHRVVVAFTQSVNVTIPAVKNNTWLRTSSGIAGV